MHAWPELPYEVWRETRDTLHMYTQVIGKLRLAFSPFEPQWGNVPLYVTACGLTTSPIPVGAGTIDAELDLLGHVLILRNSNGETERRPLGAPVADFSRDTMGALRRMGVDVAISVVPSEVADPIPFPEDHVHSTYEPAQASRFFQVLSAVDIVCKEHRARFRGRTTPVHFFWGTFDLALTRFSGRPLAPPEHAGVIRRFGGDAECVSVGWWPGDDRVRYPAFSAYASPKPDGLEHTAIGPAGAAWNDAAGEFLMPYDVARTSTDPPRAALEFFATTYAAAAGLLGWDRGLTEVKAPHPRSLTTASAREGGA